MIHFVAARQRSVNTHDQSTYVTSCYRSTPLAKVGLVRSLTIGSGGLIYTVRLFVTNGLLQTH